MSITIILSIQIKVIFRSLSKASFTLSRCTPRWVPTACSRRTGANRDKFRVRSYIPGSVTDQTRFGEKIDHGYAGNATMHYQCSPGGATLCPSAFRYIPIHYSPRNLRQSLCITTKGHKSRTAKPRCFKVAFKYQCFFVKLLTEMSFAKYKTQFT